MLKKSFFLIGSLCLAVGLTAQNAEISGVTDAFLLNTGTLTALPSPVTYTFYEAGPGAQKGHTKGVFAMYDAQMNPIFSETLDLHEDNTFKHIMDNEKEIIMALYNQSTEIMTFRIYDASGALLREEKLFYQYNIYGNFYGHAEDIGETEKIRPLPELGFFLCQPVKNKRLGYNYYFLNSSGIRSLWGSPADHNNRKNATLLYADEDLMVIHEREWSSVYDQQPLMTAIVIDVKTGEERFRVSHDYQDRPRFYTAVMRTAKNELLFFGETYNKANNYPDNDYNSGYFSERYAMDGTLLHDTELPYEHPAFVEALGLPAKAGRKKLGTLYVHQLIPDGDGFMALGEWALRETQGGGAGAALLGYATGTTASQKWTSTYVLGDFVLMKFGPDGNYLGCNRVPNTHYLTGLNDLRPRPQFNLYKMKYLGRLNYKSAVPGHPFSFFYVEQKLNGEVTDSRLMKAEPNEESYKTSEITPFAIPESSQHRFYPFSEDRVLLVTHLYGEENQKLTFTLLGQTKQTEE